MVKIILASYLLPIHFHKESENKYDFIKNDGGLCNGLMGVKDQCDFVWFGWPGSDIELCDRDAVTMNLKQKYNFVPVFIDGDEFEGKYLHYCNLLIWPIFHNLIERSEYKKCWWQSYLDINEIFAKKVLTIAQDGDLIWIHDFHLLMMPYFLKKYTKVDIKIGYFIHTNFPQFDILNLIPEAKEICGSMLETDLIGFHTQAHNSNFKECCKHFFNAKIVDNGLRFGENRLLKTEVIPFGINPNRYEKFLESDKTKEIFASLKEKYKNKFVFIGCERADYIKSIDVKLKAFDLFLEKNVELRDKCVFVEISVPCKLYLKQMKDYAQGIIDLSNEINKKYEQYGKVIENMYQPVEFEWLMALYLLGDVCVVSSISDGLNLISLEYVLCQNKKEKPGVLVLSEFAGVSAYMHTKFMINPIDLEDMADKYLNGIYLEDEERNRTQSDLYQIAITNTAESWMRKFLEKIEFSAN